VAAWAETQGKNDIFDAVDFSAPDLLHQTEADCLTNCTAIYNAGNTTSPRSPPPAHLPPPTSPTSHEDRRVAVFRILFVAILAIDGKCAQEICSVNPR